MNTYPTGSEVTVTSADSTAAGFVSLVTGTAVLTDPSVVQLSVQIAEGTPIIFSATVTSGAVGSTSIIQGTWPVTGFPVTITRTSVGLYTASLATATGNPNLASTITFPGEWIYEWTGSGAIVATKPNTFFVTSYPT